MHVGSESPRGTATMLNWDSASLLLSQRAPVGGRELRTPSIEWPGFAAGARRAKERWIPRMGFDSHGQAVTMLPRSAVSRGLLLLGADATRRHLSCGHTSHRA